MPMIVTIDGPAGTGKSTVARRLAERLGFEFLNTGAMYRAVALVCLERAIAIDDAAAVAALPGKLEIRFRENRLWLDGRDVSETIRAPAVTEAASLVASNPQVRTQLVALQRRCGDGINLVTEGRDQGTVVFPDAPCKVFLTASPEERARRRQQELSAQGQMVSFELILADQKLRDERDETRAVAPLRPAADAVVFDTSSLTAVEVLDRLEQLVRGRMAVDHR
jgi:cytidylate kinase